jgi:serine/threonine protein phosphatase PrpC
MYASITRNGKNTNNSDKINQDCYFIFENFLMIKNLFFFGVCDGHGSHGHFASFHAKYYIPANLQFLEIEKMVSNLTKQNLLDLINSSISSCSNPVLDDDDNRYNKNSSNTTIQHLIRNIYEKLQLNIKHLPFIKKLSKSICNNISDSFMRTHEDIKTKTFDYSTSGTTVCSVFIFGKSLFCANLGDSRAVLASIPEKFNPQYNSLNKFNLAAIPLSKDHKPDNPMEKERIISYNGRIAHHPFEKREDDGPLRIWFQNLEGPGLALCRSIGDTAAMKIGVIPEPGKKLRKFFVDNLKKIKKFLY